MKRSTHGHLCGVSAALDVIGDRWALLVVRELLFSAKRFTDLARGLPGIGTNTLTMRLLELEHQGILRKHTTPPPMSVTAYELTPKGVALTPTLIALARWGSRELLEATPRHRMQPAWLGLAMLAYFDPSAAPTASVAIGLVFPEGRLAMQLGRAGLRITEGGSGPAALTLSASSPELVLALLRGSVTPTAAIRRKELVLEGDRRLLAPLLASFPLGAPESRARPTTRR